jgi:hypothetical protein
VDEIWKTIPGYGGYEASDQGRVRNAATLRVLKPWDNGNGYFFVSLGAGNKRRVHHLVLEAFKGPRPCNLDGCHDNGVRSDNRADNLRWDTRAGNFADKIAHGTQPRGETHPQSKLTASQISEVHGLLCCRYSQREVAARFGVSQQLVSSIARGERRAHG